MYTTYYKLQERPFEQIDIPHFFWNGGSRSDHFEKMTTYVVENGGLLLLTGAEGLGKTVTLKALARRVQNDVFCGVITGPFLDRLDYYQAVTNSFSLEKSFTSRVEFLLHFNQFLQRAEQEQKKVLLLIDNCHTLSPELFEELRLLSNLRNADGKRLINLLMTGDESLLHLLEHPKNMMIRQQISLQSKLAPLNLQEIADYVRHRLAIAGASGPIFSEDVFGYILEHTGGNPRKVNMFCDRALAFGANLKRSLIDQSVMEHVTDPFLKPIARDEKIRRESSEKRRVKKKRVIPVNLKAENVRLILKNLINRIKQDHFKKFGLGLVLVAVITVIIYSLPSPEQENRSGKEIGPEDVEITHDQRVVVDPKLEVIDADIPGFSTVYQQEKLEEKPIDRVNNFWQLHKDNERLVKIRNENIDRFTNHLMQYPEAVLLLRSNDSQVSDKLVWEVQEQLMNKGIDPAQIKTMKPKEKVFLESIAKIAHEEGHQVIEIIVVKDGLWWGEIDGNVR